MPFAMKMRRSTFWLICRVVGDPAAPLCGAQWTKDIQRPPKLSTATFGRMLHGKSSANGDRPVPSRSKMSVSGLGSAKATLAMKVIS